MASGAFDIDINQGQINAMMSLALPPWLTGLTTEVAVVARDDCPVGEPDPLGRPRKGPRMKDEIIPHLIGSGAAVKGAVTANVPHALPVHQGARPHVIPLGGAPTMRQKGYPLRFMKDGRVRRPWSVQHPGNEPNPFLNRALLQVLGRLR